MRRRLIITGRVQGVWYRDWFVGAATALGLVGWVRNRRDGSVEAMIDGAEGAVTAMIAQAWQGSPRAQVDSVMADDASPEPPLTGFERRPSI